MSVALLSKYKKSEELDQYSCLNYLSVVLLSKYKKSEEIDQYFKRPILIKITPTWFSSKFNEWTGISGLFSRLNGTVMFFTLGSVLAIRAES